MIDSGGQPRTPAAKKAAELVRDHLTGPVAAEEWVQHVEFDPELDRWYLRFTCEGRDATTIYFDLRPRSLRYEVYFMPDPPKNHLELYRWLLRRNHHEPYNARFSIGPDGDIYLTGRVLYEHLDEEELDRIIGVCYETTETWFQTAITLGFR
ncbi:MAG TPA: YbjN domain-containing protein [Acidimicrobiia bacterium]|nr:YbjN domain-containing protein [Acidimicrobiia bacterium]